MTSSNAPDPSGQPPGAPDPADPDGSGYAPYGSPGYYERQPYGEQPAASGFPPPFGGYPQPSSTNGFAIASLILAFFCGLVGLICGVIALNQIRTTGQGGRHVAIAGIVISALSTVAWIIFWAYMGISG